MQPIKPALLATTAIIALLPFFPATSNAAPDAARVYGDIRVDGIVFNLDGSSMQTKASPWSFLGSDIFYNGGNIGIGSANTPTARLDVTGTVKATAFIGDSSGLTGIWKTGGNAGTTPGIDFIGTSDNQALEIKVNNTRAIRIEPTGTNSAPNIVAGYSSNIAGGGAVKGATVAGGGLFGAVCADSAPSTTVRTCANQATGNYSFIGGGYGNQASGFGSAVVGGDSNTASGQESIVAGGYRNRASNSNSIVAGGDYNIASGMYSIVAGGAANTASGGYSIVAGGANNQAIGDVSFAAGQQAAANHNGTFVWADYQSFGFPSTAANQFLVRAAGGVGINTNATHETVTIGGNGSAIELGSNVVGKEIHAGKIGYQRFTADALDIVGAGTTGSNRKIKFWNEGGATFTGPVYSTGQILGNSTNDIAIYGINSSTDKPAVEGWNQGTGDIFRGWSGASPVLRFYVANNGNAEFAGTVKANGTVLTSDVRLKTDIQPLENTLAKVLNLRGVSYVMKADETGERKIGVIAQELEQEYPELVSTDDKGMKSVAYANLTAVLIEAVKGLKVENDILKQRLDRIEQLLLSK